MSAENWSSPLPSDLVPAEVMLPHLSHNLCLRCGVRVWRSSMQLHDSWHDSLEGSGSVAPQPSIAQSPSDVLNEAHE